MSKKGTMIICLDCDYKWLSKWKQPLTDKAQCVKCWHYTVVTEEQYEADLQHLRKTASPNDLKKFVKIYDYLVERRYIHNVKSREIKLRKLMEDLAAEPSLGADL